MNDNDLERRLRAESGPREQGYNASQLPASQSIEHGARRSRPMRGIALAGAVAAGVLVVAASASLFGGNPRDSGVGSGGETSTPVPSATQSSPVACQPADVALTAEPWGGAAGSRGTIVTVRLADGGTTCLFANEPGAQLATESDVLVSIDGMNAQTSPMDSGQERSFAVTWSNWCGSEITEPVTLSLRSGDVAFPVTVPDGADPVPPCNGENAPSTLEVTVVAATP
jgi:hypothetical protein